MHRFVLVLSIILLGGYGCIQPIVRTGSDNDTFSQQPQIKENLSLTTEPQDAFFAIATGWSGGMGSMPILEWDTNTTKTFNDLPLYFDESYRKTVEQKLPVCFVGTPRIMISATIKLIKKTDTNHSIEDAPPETYYEADVERLNDIIIQVEACPTT